MAMRRYVVVVSLIIAVLALPVVAEAATVSRTLGAGQVLPVECRGGALSGTPAGTSLTLRCASARGMPTPRRDGIVIRPGDRANLTCATGLTTEQAVPNRVIVRCAPAAPPPAGGGSFGPGTDRAYPWATKGPTPDGRQICSQEVHDRYSVTVGGVRYHTWHPPVDPVTGCAFGHEHGTDPRAFRYFDRVGMPAFGRIGGIIDETEPHAGFKVFASNNDGRGRAWLMVLHQGSAGPRRAEVRHHSLEIWLFRNSDGALLANVSLMADFGDYIPNCTPAEQAALGGVFAPTSSGFAARFIPAPQCESVYERWVASIDVGGVFGGTPAFDIDNAITQVDPLNLRTVIPNKRAACGPFAADGWDSYCKGDKRSVIHPGWWLRNGPGNFTTDAYGRRVSGGPLTQYVRPNETITRDWTRDCCGSQNVYTMPDVSNGGLYFVNADGSVNFEPAYYCVITPN
jgi:hypothetical protein